MAIRPSPCHGVAGVDREIDQGGLEVRYVERSRSTWSSKYFELSNR